MTLIDLGWCTAKLDKERGHITIVCPVDGQTNSFFPAASVAIYGESELKKLRDALNEAYPE